MELHRNPEPGWRLSSFDLNKYRRFLTAKTQLSKSFGFELSDFEIHPFLKPHQAASVRWMVRGGRRALFSSFGLGKTVCQLWASWRIIQRLRSQGGERARGLIVAPLGVRQEFSRDAAKLGLSIKFIRNIEDADPFGLYLTNYETVRDGKLDPSEFDVTSLDEAAVLRGFGGSKTFREFMRLFESVEYRFVATATPDPNEYIELLAYAAYLGIMDVSQAKTRFFKRDSTKADKLTLHPHKEEEFWMWVSTWALFLQRPSDLGFSDEGYALPEMRIVHHEIPAGPCISSGQSQGRIFRDASLGVTDAAREKRDSLDARVEVVSSIIAAEPEKHYLIWHDLEAERHSISAAIPTAAVVYGSQNLEEREQVIIDFSEGRIKDLAAKPVIAGSGCNFQYHCHTAIFAGIGFKFADFLQAIHRIYRFLQANKVTIHLVYTSAELPVLKILMDKWDRHKEKVAKMSEIIRKYGLSELALAQAMVRSLGVDRCEVRGVDFTVVNNDCVEETASMPDNSVGLIVTSIPFATQYEYSPSVNDFGHTDDNSHFFEQMNFLSPELLRVLQPGRIAAVHVKDRIVPGGMTGLGFQTVYPFHARCIEHFTRHGFAYMGMKTIVTDVVRENNQTYRLGWSEQCKDGSKMGCGMPEYLLLFRKPPSDNSNSYADIPVVKNKRRYSRSRWQIDAHGFTRSSGDRLLTAEEILDLPHDVIFRMFREFSLATVYDFEHHVHIGESLERWSANRGLCECAPEICRHGRLPVTFMLLQPPSWHEDVWTDVTRMLTLNSSQYAKGKEMHLCPLQFDLVDRVIEQFSNVGDVVYDPFGGLMTVPYRAIDQRRFGIGCELNPSYFLDGAAYCKAAEAKAAMPSLFDAIDPEPAGVAA
jgi:DNA modification methylase